MGLNLTPELNELNNLAKDHKEEFYRVRRSYLAWLWRVAVRELKPPAFMLISAIAGRTLGWGKYAEIIPYAHFIQGVRDDSNCLKELRGEFAPVFAGISLRKEETISKYVRQLIQAGYIEQFKLRRGSGFVNAYLPMPRRALAFHLIAVEALYLPRRCLELLENQVVWCPKPGTSALQPQKALVQIQEVTRQVGRQRGKPLYMARCVLKGPFEEMHGEPFEVPSTCLRLISPAEHDDFRADEYRSIAELTNGIEHKPKPFRLRHVPRPCADPRGKGVSPGGHHFPRNGGALPPRRGE